MPIYFMLDKTMMGCSSFKCATAALRRITDKLVHPWEVQEV
jgi:hypothetical protein